MSAGVLHVTVSQNASVFAKAVAVAFSNVSPNSTTIISQESDLSPPPASPPPSPSSGAVKTRDSARKVEPVVLFLRADKPKPAATPIITVDPKFKLIFLVTVGLTVFVSLLAVCLGLFGSESDRVDDLISTFSTLAKIGFGSIVGLLGGKATDGGSKAKGKKKK